MKSSTPTRRALSRARRPQVYRPQFLSLEDRLAPNDMLLGVLTCCLGDLRPYAAGPWEAGQVRSAPASHSLLPPPTGGGSGWYAEDAGTLALVLSPPEGSARDRADSRVASGWPADTADSAVPRERAADIMARLAGVRHPLAALGGMGTSGDKSAAAAEPRTAALDTRTPLARAAAPAAERDDVAPGVPGGLPAAAPPGEAASGCSGRGGLGGAGWVDGELLGLTATPAEVVPLDVPAISQTVPHVRPLDQSVGRAGPAGSGVPTGREGPQGGFREGYASFLGGAGADGGQGITLDADYNAYVTGYYHNGRDTDAFVAKVNRTGTYRLLYFTPIGGPGNDVGRGITLDEQGNVYVTGAWDTGTDAFLAKLNVDGTLVALLLRGTPGDDAGHGVAFASDAVYATGAMASAAGTDLWVGKFSRDLDPGYFFQPPLGDGPSFGNGIDVDAAGQAYVAGGVTQGNLRRALIAKVDASGQDFLWARAVPADRSEGRGLALDALGNVYATGTVTEDPFRRELFVAKLEPQGGQRFWAFRYGIADRDLGANAIRVNESGEPYVAGFIQRERPAIDKDALLLRFDGDGLSRILARAEPGGSQSDTGTALVLAPEAGGGGERSRAGPAIPDTCENAYMTGVTESEDFAPISPTAFQKDYGGGGTDGFVLRLEDAATDDCDGCQPAMLTFVLLYPGAYWMTWTPGCTDPLGFEVYDISDPFYPVYWDPQPASGATSLVIVFPGPGPYRFGVRGVYACCETVLAEGNWIT